MPVTTNLAAALRHVKKHWEITFPTRDKASFRLWVDALCINQDDIKERNIMVPLMNRVYKSAEIVLVWMGSEDEQVPLAFQTVELLYTLIKSKFPLDDQSLMGSSLNSQDLTDLTWLSAELPLCQDDDGRPPGLKRHNRQWDSIGYLLELPYWQRLWILQEAALAPRLLLTCPSQCIDFLPLILVAHFMMEQKIQLENASQTQPIFMSSMPWLKLTALMPSWPSISRIGVVREALGHPGLPLFSVSRFARHYCASNPKDYIYGFLGVTGMKIQPDYSSAKSISDVLCEYADMWINLCQEEQGPHGNSVAAEVDFLADAGVGFYPQNLGIPSWAPHYPHAQYYGSAIRLYGHADRSVFPRSVERERSSVEGHTLTVRGVALQKVYQMAAPSVDTSGNAMSEYICSFIHRYERYVTGISSSQAVLRVIYRDADTQISYASGGRIVAFAPYLARIVLDAKTVKSSQIAAIVAILCEYEPDIPFDEGILEASQSDTEHSHDRFHDLYRLVFRHSSKIMWYTEKVVRDFKGRRLFDTNDGYLGLAPEGTRLDDIVCILKGSGVPVILRKSGDHYIHVGVCWVVGLMEGEAKQFLEDGRTKIETFELR